METCDLGTAIIHPAKQAHKHTKCCFNPGMAHDLVIFPRVPLIGFSRSVLVDGLDVVTMMDRACEQHVGHPLNTDLHAFLSNQR
jgi:hypothetical protein